MIFKLILRNKNVFLYLIQDNLQGWELRQLEDKNEVREFDITDWEEKRF